MAGTYSDWSPYTGYVQGGMADGKHASGITVMLAAGPPRLAAIGGAAFASRISGQNPNTTNAAGSQLVYPMGLIQQVSVSQNKQFNRLWELGSDRSYAVSGRSQGGINLGRAYYHGASLLRVMYAYYQDLLPPTIVPAMFPNVGAANMANPHNVIIPPGYENIYFNLGSDLFSQPVGILMYMRDTNESTLGAQFAEAVVCPSFNWSVDAQGCMVSEQVSLQYERIVPVAVTELALVTGSANTNTYQGIANS